MEVRRFLEWLETMMEQRTFCLANASKGHGGAGTADDTSREDSAQPSLKRT
jgi:hypothetical protein